MTKRHEGVQPSTLDRDIAMCRSLLADGRLASGVGLAVKYKWAWSVATVAGSGPEVHTRGLSRPTEKQALDPRRDRARAACARAARAVELAKKALLDAEAAVDSVLPHHRPGGMKEGEAFPGHRPVTKAELEDSLAAQVKRTQRGEIGGAA